MTVTWDPDFRWYSIGRPYDWLLRRRHGLRNAREGEIDRTVGWGYQLGFRGTPVRSADWRVIHVFDRLEVRQLFGPPLGRGVGESRHAARTPRVEHLGLRDFSCYRVRSVRPRPSPWL